MDDNKPKDKKKTTIKKNKNIFGEQDIKENDSSTVNKNAILKESKQKKTHEKKENNTEKETKNAHKSNQDVNKDKSLTTKKKEIDQEIEKKSISQSKKDKVSKKPTSLNADSLETQASSEDLEYMSDTSAAMLMKAPRGGRLLIYIMILTVISAFIWANLTELDEITRGEGKVIPSSRLQVIQNLEGGILEELFVYEGMLVNKGQTLLRLDDTKFSSNFKESAIEYYSELAKTNRLQAELNHKEIQFSDQLKEFPQYINREQRIFDERRKGKLVEEEIAQKQVSQSNFELEGLKSKLIFLTNSLNLGLEELKLTEPLAQKGVVSHIELIQLKQKVNDLASERKMTELEIPRIEAALQESIARKKELEITFREEVVEMLQEAEANLDQLRETHKDLKDQVSRTLVRSPVTGIVKSLYINTIGGVVKPGMDLMDIVPFEDNLLIEAKIKPKDVGFLRKGMKALVKLTAYDFSIYGGLKGTLEYISADTVENKKEESFYIVHIRTDKNNLGSEDKKLEIIPGMKTSVDILTGKKTVMDYILKPIIKAKKNALTER